MSESVCWYWQDWSQNTDKTTYQKETIQCSDILIIQLQSMSIIWPSHTHSVWISHCQFYLKKINIIFFLYIGNKLFFFYTKEDQSPTPARELKFFQWSFHQWQGSTVTFEPTFPIEQVTVKYHLTEIDKYLTESENYLSKVYLLVTCMTILAKY